MRSTHDRIRHTIMFETGLLILFAPIISILWGKSLLTSGNLSIGLSALAMGVNYCYNLIFDHLLLRCGRSTVHRSMKIRVLHAICFELSLLVFSLPLIAAILEISIFHAFLLDIGFTLFTLVYTFIFNWAYDHFFTAPEPCEAPLGDSSLR